MSTYVWCELVCDCCSASIVGQYTSGSRVPRRELKEEAKKVGAVFSFDKVYCSEAHYAVAPHFAAHSAVQGDSHD